jgi:hypothetical protein
MKLKLAYCDKIADTIRRALLKHDADQILGPVGKTEWDLHPTEGYLVSTKKSMVMYDTNGKAYRITVEEAPHLDVEYEDVDQKVVDNEFV